jgi:hypothetical protein
MQTMSYSLTATIKDRLKFPDDKTFVKNLISDQIRGLIRQYGIAGESDPMWLRLQYEIPFVHPSTARHLGQFQGMWRHRGAHKDTAAGDWWWAFNAYLKDCCEEVKVATENGSDAMNLRNGQRMKKHHTRRRGLAGSEHDASATIARLRNAVGKGKLPVAQPPHLDRILYTTISYVSQCNACDLGSDRQRRRVDRTD